MPWGEVVEEWCDAMVATCRSWILSLKDRCCRCAIWIKYSLFSINFLVWIGGVCLLIIGTWARLEKFPEGSLENLATDPVLVLLLMGTVMCAISILGCLGSLRENVCLLKIFITIIALAFVAEVICGILTVVFLDTVKLHMASYMRAAIDTYHEDPDLKNALDYIQKQFQCCGASSFNDWEVNIYYNCSSPAQSRCGVPISCCKIRTNIQCGFGARTQGEIYAAQGIYTDGCIDSLMQMFKDNLMVLGLVAFGVGFLELFSILLAHVFIKHIIFATKSGGAGGGGVGGGGGSGGSEPMIRMRTMHADHVTKVYSATTSYDSLHGLHTALMEAGH